MPTNTEQFAQTVTRRRNELGLTQLDIAAAGGPSDTTQRKIESGEATSISAQTLRKYDQALRWDEGSAAGVLAGGEPTVAIVLRDREGVPTYKSWGVQGAEQPDLERLRLAALLADARDIARRERSPQMTALGYLVDEAFELAVRSVARQGDNDLDDAELARAQKRVDDVRVTGALRRQGAVYVVDDVQRVPSRAAALKAGGAAIRGRIADRPLTSNEPGRDLDEAPRIDLAFAEPGEVLIGVTSPEGGTFTVADLEEQAARMTDTELVAAHEKDPAGYLAQWVQARRPELLEQKDFDLANRRGRGKSRGQVEYEDHATAGEEPDASGPESGA